MGLSPWVPRAWAPALLFVLAFGAAFVTATPYSLLDSERFVADVRFVFTHLSDGHGIDVGRGWTYHLRRSLLYGVGVPTCVAAVAGLVPLARRLRWHAVVLGVAAGAFYVSVGSGSTVFFRYVLPLVPIVCLSAAVGIRSIGEWISVRSGASQTLVMGVLTLVVAVPSLVQSAWFDVLLAPSSGRDRRFVSTAAASRRGKATPHTMLGGTAASWTASSCMSVPAR